MHMGGLEQQGGGGGVLHCNTRVYLQLYFSIREVFSLLGTKELLQCPGCSCRTGPTL